MGHVGANEDSSKDTPMQVNPREMSNIVVAIAPAPCDWIPLGGLEAGYDGAILYYRTHPVPFTPPSWMLACYSSSSSSPATIFSASR
ncbi:hypothetical protein HJFPF1_02049 [Paramyrothecium foliicola]|nr:hypothetical protein HJFPF1_02049 [Paramyrothecium foliicola]